MDINAAAKEYGNGVITSLKKNRRILIMMLLFAAGMIIGALSLKKADSYLSGARYACLFHGRVFSAAYGGSSGTAMPI